MNILIVNAFGKSLNDKKKFASFCTIIKNLLKKLSENSGIDNFNFIYRTPNTITDFNYNYECNPGEESKESLINKKNFDKLDYEKVQFRRVLIYLANFKRKNFVDFLKMTNISKYIQYFVCYIKEYDKELNDLAKNVYKNFHKQFNKEYFGNIRYKV